MRRTLLLFVLAACTTGAERSALDGEVGVLEQPPLAIHAELGNAQIRELTPTSLTMWSQTPEVGVEIRNDGPDIDEFSVVFANAMATTDFVATADGVPIGAAVEVERQRVTERQLRVPIRSGQTVLVRLVANPMLPARYRVAVMGDIQTALNDVDDVFEMINDTPDLEFVMSTGDIVESAKEDEFDLFDLKLERLRIPFYSTIGNHELRADPERWHTRYGRFSIYFVYRGVAWSFVDSGNASIHQDATARLLDSLEANSDRLHLVGTHYPPFDPVGGRQGSFRSRKEASAFLSRLSAGHVDATFYGHIHSYYAYTNAGIPAFISGGGGALPELWDGIGRHFLVVTVDGTDQSVEVGLVRVD